MSRRTDKDARKVSFWWLPPRRRKTLIGGLVGLMASAAALAVNGSGTSDVSGAFALFVALLFLAVIAGFIYLMLPPPFTIPDRRLAAVRLGALLVAIVCGPIAVIGALLTMGS